MTLVGREPELERLTDLLHRAESVKGSEGGALSRGARGQSSRVGAFAVITGEAGIGKTA
jgi:predicted ATPase